MNRSPVNYDHDEETHNTLVKRQGKMTKNNVTLKYSNFIPIWSTVAVHHEDVKSWIHGRVIEHDNVNCSDRS